MTIARRMKQALEVPEGARDANWVREHLQTAVALELSTLPPYLTAWWSIRSSGSAKRLLKQVVLQEMLHMGLICNCLNALGDRPRIAFRDVVQRYPAHLPGGVQVDLVVPLQRFSLDAVARMFMKIEEPSWNPFITFGGEQWPTIGAFYSAIVAAVQTLDPTEFTPHRRQIEEPGLSLTTINVKADCLAALDTIMVQGEGTTGSPAFGGGPDDIAHYYKFAEILHGRKFVKGDDGCWHFSGDAIPHLDPRVDVFLMDEVPAYGYPDSLQFDFLFTQMLQSLQNAWDTGISSIVVQQAEALMLQMTVEARRLMQLPKPDGSGLNFGPDFQFLGA